MPEISPTHNQIEYTVTEVSNAIKRVVEDTFGYIRLRGEISGLKLAASGHMYLALKDDQSVMDAVCWRGTVSKFSFKPEDGLEVVCTGRITTYGGRSKYQMIIERMEPAGVGALMALLEKRKMQLAAEGLFRPERKKPLPFLPEVIGVVTSPTGAVIRDILHRISDRFPRHVIVWPVLVQGDGAAEQIAQAIRGFNAGGNFPRPDVLIVARGGGSIEDLWAFNEEIVVRAAAESAIPLISAVGHETDTTLIDYASDLRAPTPTAAAELAVPVREEWRLTLLDHMQRLTRSITRTLQQRGDTLASHTRILARMPGLTEQAAQRLDEWGERLHSALPKLLQIKSHQMERFRLQPSVLLQPIRRYGQDIAALEGRLHSALPKLLQIKQHQLARFALPSQRLLQQVKRQQQDTTNLSERLQQAYLRYLRDAERRVHEQARILENLDYRRILQRGYAIVRDEEGNVITSATAVQPHQRLQLQLKDGTLQVQAE